MKDHLEYAEGLRQVAAFLESHPEIQLPEATLTCYGIFSKDVAATTALALSQGGRCDKVFEDMLVTLTLEAEYVEIPF